jgi:hypothetical protein
MFQHRSPSISEFVYVSAQEWLTLMSGILTVPFAILAFVFPNVRWIFVALAVIALRLPFIESGPTNADSLLT